MEYYALVLILLGAVIGAYFLGKAQSRHNGAVGFKDGYKEGWYEAKQFYHDEPREDREREIERIEKLNEDNAKYIQEQRIEELCIAYGVAHPSSLPKNVREANNIPLDSGGFNLYTDEGV